MDTEANTFPDPLLQQHQPAPVAPAPRRRPGRVRGWTISGVLVLVLIVTIVYLAIGQIPQETPPIEADRWCLASNAQFSSQVAHVSFLSHIVAITTSNLWVLGTIDTGDVANNTARQTPLFEHWDGKNWSTIPGADTSALVSNLSSQMPGPKNISIQVNELAALSANNIWAIGGVSIEAKNEAHGLEHTLIEHWDGKRWSLVPSPDGVGSVFVNELNGISVVSTNDIWAVGVASTGDHFTALIEHWDGKQWDVVQSPGIFTGDYLTNVAAFSQHDIWVFGSSEPPTPNYAHESQSPLVAHWNGSTWEKDHPIVGGIAMSSVVALASDNIWAVTQRDYPYPPTDDYTTYTGLIHWNGKDWETMGAPDNLDNGGNLSAIAANRPDDIWLVGSNTHRSPWKMEVEHWDGEVWQSVQQNFSPLTDVSMVTIKDGKIWLVGNGPGSSGDSQNWFILDNC